MPRRVFSSGVSMLDTRKRASGRVLVVAAIIVVAIGLLPTPARASTIFVPATGQTAGPNVYDPTATNSGPASFTFSPFPMISRYLLARRSSPSAVRRYSGTDL